MDFLPKEPSSKRSGSQTAGVDSSNRLQDDVVKLVYSSNFDLIFRIFSNLCMDGDLILYKLYLHLYYKEHWALLSCFSPMSNASVFLRKTLTVDKHGSFFCLTEKHTDEVTAFPSVVSTGLCFRLFTAPTASYNLADWAERGQCVVWFL